MKNVEPLLSLRRFGLRSAAAAAAMTLAAASHGAATDIANIPVVELTAAQVKPNVMLLMDASGSMARTHMPDEVETQTRPTSIGYKSHQCNRLYYNPTTFYVRPKAYDGSSLPLPTFSAARYAGFGNYYATQDLSTTNLNTQFVAYDATTLEVVSPFPDTPQAAYYFVYSGAQTLGFASAPCTDPDVSTPSVGGSFAATGGGTWTKVIVNTLSASDQENFAVWYSYYRTRLSMIKSAASLTFATLNDTKRVGFITVEPKNSPSDSTINPLRYLKVGDFDLAQKNLWFSKLFSQRAQGSSPAREGLARVGRYYAGREDGINGGMAATGVNDPIQYSCQQNFTILTTDGYWNGQTETPGNGGPLQMDGVARVDQQDGGVPCPLSDPYCPRPIWDGGSATTRIVTDKTNAYTDNICSLAGRYRSTFQTRREVSFLTKDTTRTTRRTLQYTQSTNQSLARTTQTTRLVEQQSRTTQQFAERRDYWIEERFQHVMSQEQTTQVREQYELQTSQQLAQTFQTRRVETRATRTREQWSTARQQLFDTRTQYVSQTEQFRLQRRQVLKYQYQTIAYDKSQERGDALAGDCTPSPGNYPIECRVTVITPTQPVDPASCPLLPDPFTTGPGPTFIKTLCTVGPLATPEQPVASCTPGVTAPDSGNGFVESTCSRVTTAPAAAFNGTCTTGTTQGPAPDYFLYTCSRPATNNTSVAVASCGALPAPTGPDWITASCGPSGPNNQPATPSLPCTVGSTTDGALITTTCSKTIDEPAAYAATCLADPGTSAPFIRVTCSTETLFDAPVASASCSPGTGPGPDFIVTTCPKTAAGPIATQIAVSACAPGATTGAPDHYETACTTPPATNRTDPVTAATCGPLGVTAGVAPDWITRDCRKPAANNGSAFINPNFCIPDPGTSFPFLKVDCNTAQTMAPTPVDPTTTCTSFGTTVGPDPFITTICQKQGVSPPTNVGACVPGIGPGPQFIVTTCGFASFDTPVASCVVGSTWTDGIYTVTCVAPAGPNNATVFVPPNTCTAPAASAPNWVYATCSTVATISSGVVDPATCTVPYSVGAGPNFYGTTCTTVGVGPYPTATPVPSPCVNSVDGSFVTTTCSTGVNTPAAPSGPCTVGTTTDGSYVSTTCALSDNTEYVPTASCSNVTQSGTGPEIICTTVTTLGTPTATCSAGAVAGAPFYDTTIPVTGCHDTVTSPMADFAGVCTPGATGTLGERVTCGRGPAIDSLVSDSGCVDGTNPSTGIITECTNQANPGRTYAVVTTQTVTTTPYSGTVATGPGVVATTVGSPTPVSGGQCLGAPPPMPAQPPVDIAGCSAWPCTTIVANAGGSRNSLADVAQYYYKTDLRTTMVDNVIPAATGPEDDNAPHQHMTTFTLGLGVSGTLRYRSDYRDLATTTGDFAEIRAGTRDWPLWPDPAVDYSDALNYNNPKSVDDFWHTAVTGRGTYFNASFPSEAVQGLGNALSKVDDRTGSGTGEAVSTLQPVAGNNFAYSTTYTAGSWSGDLQARLLNLGTGAAGPEVWSAKAKLGGRVFAACDDRNIYLIRGGNTLVDFTWETQRCPGGTNSGGLVTALNAAEQALVGAAGVAQLSHHAFMTDGAGGSAPQRQAAEAAGALVNFLRGQDGKEGFVTNSATRLFRTRDGALGDIVNSQPVYVKQPFANYLENGYATFKATPRTPMVYVGANDGMLHAFHATLDLLDPLHGQEAWAVIPSAVLPNMWKLADEDYKRDGHRYYVDGSPVAGDIWTGSAWKTLLVGGLNAGGKGYYALDVTTPGSAPTVRWEFKQSATCAPSAPTAMPLGTYTSDCNLGLTFGKPVITKLAGVWVVMFTSGYNNVNGVTGDGGGYLYVVNAWDGTLIHKIPTGAGDATTPSGLAQINNYVDDVLVDNTTRRVYGGDALGNMWRFDFTPTPVATRLGTTSAAATGLPQPITVRPELAELDGKPFVMFGTGRLLGTSDVGNSQVQSVYGFRDTLSLTAPIYPNPIRNVLRKMQIVAGGTAQADRTATCASACGQSEGWVLDLLEAGERVNVEMKLVNGALVFASNVPEVVPCEFGGHSWFNQVDFRTGSQVPTSTFTSQFLNDALNVGFNVLQLPVAAGSNNPSYTGLFRQSNTASVNRGVTPPEPVASGKRISWREIVQ